MVEVTEQRKSQIANVKAEAVRKVEAIRVELKKQLQAIEHDDGFFIVDEIVSTTIHPDVNHD
jgi:hypothetical protein